MEKVFIDTSAWVALFVTNDKNNKKAASIYTGLVKSRISLYTSDYVLDETITLIAIRGDRSKSLAAGHAILSSKLLNIVPVFLDHFQPAWRLFQKYKDKNFSFTDVTSFAIMKALNISKAFGFDHEFTQAGIQLLE